MDKQLEKRLLRLLQEANQNPSGNPTAQRFARYLASFAEAWATNEDTAAAHEQRLSNWIESIGAEEVAPAYERQVARPGD